MRAFIEACKSAAEIPYNKENLKWMASGTVMAIAFLIPGILGLSGVVAISHTSSCVLTSLGSIGFVSLVIGSKGFFSDVHRLLKFWNSHVISK